MTCLFFHLWTQWEQYERKTKFVYMDGANAGKTEEGVEERQRRTCTRCGYKQDRPVGA